jgi:hypothetical protein
LKARIAGLSLSRHKALVNWAPFIRYGILFEQMDFPLQPNLGIASPDFMAFKKCEKQRPIAVIIETGSELIDMSITVHDFLQNGWNCRTTIYA